MRFPRNLRRATLGDYVKPTPGSDPALWDPIDKQETSGWTPEVLQSLIANAKDFDELDHLLFSLQYARDVTYNTEGAEAFQGRMRVGALMDPILAIRRQWLQNQINIALQAQSQLGWYSNPLLVPGENYTLRSNDLTNYGKALIAMYGGLNPPDSAIRVVQAHDNGAPVNLSAPEVQAWEVKKREDAIAAANAAAAAAQAAHQAAAQAAAQATANPTPANNAVATQTALDAQDAQHVATSTGIASNSVNEVSPSAGIVKLLGLAFTLWTLGR